MKRITELPMALINKGYRLEINGKKYQLFHKKKEVGSRDRIEKLVVMAWSRERDRYQAKRDYFNDMKMELI